MNAVPLALNTNSLKETGSYLAICGKRAHRLFSTHFSSLRIHNCRYPLDKLA
jgi:hypothetical protein